MGLEGVVVSVYFKVCREIIPEKWKFSGRNRHPLKDPVKALFSLSYVMMFCNVIHVMILGEEITNFTKNGIIGNSRNSLLIYPHKLCNLPLGPSQTLQLDDNDVSDNLLACSRFWRILIFQLIFQIVNVNRNIRSVNSLAQFSGCEEIRNRFQAWEDNNEI